LDFLAGVSEHVHAHRSELSDFSRRQRRGIDGAGKERRESRFAAYRNEEDILAAATDRERFYTEVVLPDKLRLNLDYMQRVSLGFDLALILMTLRVMPPRRMPRANILEIRSTTTSRMGEEEAPPRVKNALRAKSPHAREGH